MRYKTYPHPSFLRFPPKLAELLLLQRLLSAAFCRLHILHIFLQTSLVSAGNFQKCCVNTANPTCSQMRVHAHAGTWISILHAPKTRDKGPFCPMSAEAPFIKKARPTTISAALRFFLSGIGNGQHHVYAASVLASHWITRQEEKLPLSRRRPDLEAAVFEIKQEGLKRIELMDNRRVSNHLVAYFPRISAVM